MRGIPLHAGYKIVIADNVKVVFRAGPYLAYAVDGKYKVGTLSVDAFKNITFIRIK